MGGLPLFNLLAWPANAHVAGGCTVKIPCLCKCYKMVSTGIRGLPVIRLFIERLH